MVITILPTKFETEIAIETTDVLKVKSNTRDIAGLMGFIKKVV